MKTREYKKVYITKKGENSILLGHPWVYEGEIVKTDSGINNGDIVDITNDKHGVFIIQKPIRILIESEKSNLIHN